MSKQLTTNQKIVFSCLLAGQQLGLMLPGKDKVTPFLRRDSITFENLSKDMWKPELEYRRACGNQEPIDDLLSDITVLSASEYVKRADLPVTRLAYEYPAAWSLIA